MMRHPLTWIFISECSCSLVPSIRTPCTVQTVVRPTNAVSGDTHIFMRGCVCRPMYVNYFKVALETCWPSRLFHWIKVLKVERENIHRKGPFFFSFVLRPFMKTEVAPNVPEAAMFAILWIVNLFWVFSLPHMRIDIRIKSFWITE
jgi:hypothetical protein